MGRRCRTGWHHRHDAVAREITARPARRPLAVRQRAPRAGPDSRLHPNRAGGVDDAPRNRVSSHQRNASLHHTRLARRPDSSRRRFRDRPREHRARRRRAAGAGRGVHQCLGVVARTRNGAAARDRHSIRRGREPIARRAALAHRERAGGCDRRWRRAMAHVDAHGHRPRHRHDSRRSVHDRASPRYVVTVVRCRAGTGDGHRGGTGAGTANDHSKPALVDRIVAVGFHTAFALDASRPR